jgi:hypothetical protein
MAFQPTFKPKLKDNYYIFNTKTGLYSRGGTGPKWGRSPKTWTKGGIKLHLVQLRDFYSEYRVSNGFTYNFDTDFIYDIDSNTKTTDITLAGFLIKSSYDDKLKDVNRYRDNLHQYYETLVKATEAGLKKDVERYDRYVQSYRTYYHNAERDLAIIQTYATKYGVTV